MELLTHKGRLSSTEKTDIFGLKKQVKFKQFNFTYLNLVVFFQGGEEIWKVFMIQSMLAFLFSLLCFMSLKIKKDKYCILNFCFDLLEYILVCSTQGAKNTMNFDIYIQNSISFLASDFVKAGIRKYLQLEWGLSSCD